MAGWDFDVFQALYPEWDTSGWEVVVIQSGPRKVHLAVQVDLRFPVATRVLDDGPAQRTTRLHVRRRHI
jgi:hypothetical protein